MVAQHDARTVPESLGMAQAFKRARPAIDQISGQPHHITSGRELQTLQQAFELNVTSLQIANRPLRHAAPPAAWRPAT
ncbi:hypothetical protein HHA02_27980 [Cobetia marina]|nr:hypothetical protein HHA02_27980 [Cobetia marina]